MVPVQFFSQMVWTFLVAPDGYFFCTSDNPAYLYATRRTENKTTPLGLASPDAEILFPLHRKVCAHGRWGTGDGGYRQLTREQLDGVNFITVVKSYRYFYSPAKTEWLLKFFELKVLEQIAKNQPQPQL